VVLRLRDHFPGAELVFDCYSPIHVWVHNFQIGTLGGVSPYTLGNLARREARGLGGPFDFAQGRRHPPARRVGFFDRPEPRLAPYGWLRLIDSLFRTLRIYHFQLGKMTAL